MQGLLKHDSLLIPGPSTMDPVASFPHLSYAEFQTACTTLEKSYASLHPPEQGAWMSVEVQTLYDERFLRITKELPPIPTQKQPDHHASPAAIQTDSDNPEPIDHAFEIQEDDDPETLTPINPSPPLLRYDILLSPTYLVPTLYLHTCPLHLFPPTLSTLHTHILDPAYTSQTKHVGVLGGITVTDHPVENRPVFFMHPCRTAEVMQASAGERDVSPFEYLVMWMGAMGRSVGLEVPMALGVRAREGLGR